MTDLIGGELLPIEKHVLEADVQKSSVDHARNVWGAYARKFSSPGNRSVPDYIFVLFGFTWYVEFKAPGKEATKAQAEEHELIRAAGGLVDVIDNFALFKRRFKEVYGHLC